MNQSPRIVATAIVMDRPGHVALSEQTLTAPAESDAVIEIRYTAISTGTEKLLWAGRMPQFPGMGYPLVPGYEAVGRVSVAGAASGRQVGETVFVPGATCFTQARGLFGADASRLVVPGSRAMPIDSALDERGVLLALAATAYHVSSGAGQRPPELIVGHGVLGRLLARLAMLRGVTPVVWESNPQRRSGHFDYPVIDAADDDRRNYACIADCSGDASLFDALIGRLAPQGELVLAGFYEQPVAFAFAPAFMREARLRIAAQWLPGDLTAVRDLVHTGALSLDGLISHRASVVDAPTAFRTAFEDAACTKMLLDWSALT